MRLDFIDNPLALQVFFVEFMFGFLSVINFLFYDSQSAGNVQTLCSLGILFLLSQTILVSVSLSVKYHTVNPLQASA